MVSPPIGNQKYLVRAVIKHVKVFRSLAAAIRYHSEIQLYCFISDTQFTNQSRAGWPVLERVPPALQQIKPATVFVCLKRESGPFFY